MLIYVAFGFAALLLVNSLLTSSDEPFDIDLAEFEAALEADEIESVLIKSRSDEIIGEFKADVDLPEEATDNTFRLSYPNEYEGDLTAQILERNVPFETDSEIPSGLQSFIFGILPYLLIFGIFIFFIMQMQGGGNRVMQFGKSRAKQVSKDSPKVTFKDVAGAEEAVEELHEIKEFLQSPGKFRAMGAKIPRGVLLFGPPGTGKTLLAKAVAGEAGVPFFSISGSDFVEMFVGVGASRVRDLFEQAKSHAPAIVFIDEIDAVGRHRGAGLGGGHDEREQTLNQLLVELDGFDAKSGVIVIAATNRPDILDPALLRPGRFDRQIIAPRPDLNGRHAILKVHSKGKPLADGIDLEVLAKQTPGFTGADLANLINEAALLSARRDRTEIGMNELEEAIDRILAGPERKSHIMSDDEKKLTAYHEGGHALVGYALPNADPVHKVTIIPRGRAGGYTKSLPEADRDYQRRTELVDRLAVALGGRAAEEIIFEDPSTGAHNDIEQATKLAKAMVMEYGMSDRLGPMRYGTAQGEVFLGRDYTHGQDYSNDVASLIDEEVRELIFQAREEAREILVTHIDALHRVAEMLLEKETIGQADLAEAFHDVPKWEHAESGALRIRAPKGLEIREGGMVAAQGPDEAPV
ncbi:MAG: ATP-dependent metallopeptidase FtsH/Yme1/Tma family protein [Acidimicrobiia bacterium]|nr:ATP-dependent metallopeptidase FtsH/Yme1/Tma family protein [Acidimicrobiia bacterium]